VVLFARSRARRWANRIVYGKRATPYEVLSEFAERVGETYSTEDVLPRMAQLLEEATGARTARVWLRIGGEMRSEATWPPDAPSVANVSVRNDELPSFGDDDVFEVRHQGELLGALSVAMPAADPMNPTKAKLARDMAAQAGLVLRNVRLIEDVRESRRRIVAAQDVRAKKLERDIHDGAQQQLVALAVKVGLAERLVGADAEKAAAMLGEVKGDATEALENLRDLARGIYPPVLADQGLAAALGAQARKAPLPVAIEPDGIGRYPAETEAAVYFSCLEALQNVAKYASASTAAIRLAQHDDVLTFEVSDDGRGFDLGSTNLGTGLQGMTDRIEAVGGTIEIESAVGAGTTVRGRIPASRTDAG
jgi:signal transduction histidine kinase